MEGKRSVSSGDESTLGVKISKIKSILKPFSFRSSVSSRYSAKSTWTVTSGSSQTTISTDVEQEIENTGFLYKPSETNISFRKFDKEVIEEPEPRPLFRRSRRIPKKKEEKIETVNVDTRYVLTPFEAIAAVSILEDTLDELAILKYLLPAANMKWFEGYKTIDERFGIDPEKSRLFPEEGDKPVMTELTKVQCDRTFIEEVLRDTLHGLETTRSFEALVEAIDNAHKMHNEEALLIYEQKENLRQIKELREKIAVTQKSAEKQLNLRTEISTKLRDKLHDEMVKGQIRNRFVQHWENSRQEQNDRMLGDAENNLKKQLDTLQQELDEECRVNTEIENFLIQLHVDIEDGIDHWMRRYDVQVEEMDATLLKLRINKDAAIEEYNRLTELYEIHRREIEEYLEYKEIQRIEREEQERLAVFATRIQAWWRGYLVRSGWGKYRKIAQKMWLIAAKYGHGMKKKKGKKGKGKKKGKK